MSADNTFPDKVGQHPIRAVNGQVRHRFANIFVSERSDTAALVFKIFAHCVERRAFLKLRILQCRQKIFFAGKTAEHRICQRFAGVRVEVAKSCIVTAGLKRNIFQHFIHVKFDETYNQIRAVERKTINRHGDDNFFVGAVRIFYGNFRIVYFAVLERVLVNIGARSPRSVNQTVHVNEGKFFQVVKLFHSRLISLKSFHTAEVIRLH